MKLFPEFGSCFGGEIVSAAEAAVVGRQTEEQGGYCHSNAHRSKRLVRVRRGGGAVTYWKPKLNAISENSPVTEANSGGANRRTAGVDNKKLVKVKPKSPAKAAQPLSHVEDYWKSSDAVVIPAFSPTSFLF